VLEVLGAAGKLGLTSFGGPIAHIGYFRDEYVRRRRWLAEDEFADLVGLCQSLPGPASSQLGIAIGMQRAGLAGGLAAWLAFTAPSAIALIALAGVVRAHDVTDAGWVQGLKLVAVAVVAHAVLAMWRALVTDWKRAALAIAAAATVLLWTSPVAQVAVIAGGAAVGRLLLSAPLAGSRRALDFGVSRRAAVVALGLFGALLLLLPLVGRVSESHSLALADAFYRSGALVFGGGHVVLPLLDARVVDPGWVSQRRRERRRRRPPARRALPAGLHDRRRRRGRRLHRAGGIRRALPARPALGRGGRLRARRGAAPLTGRQPAGGAPVAEPARPCALGKRTCRWSSWLGYGSTTSLGPRRPVR
jgi:chromate transporter